MNSIYLNQLSAYSIVEQDHNHNHPPLSTSRIDNPSFSCPLLLNTQVHEAIDRGQHHHQHQHQQESNGHLVIGGSNIHLLSLPVQNKDNGTTIQSFSECYNRVESMQRSAKWMSSKMRLMKKMMSSDQMSTSKLRRNMQAVHEHRQTREASRHNSRTSNMPEGIIRTCSDCHTTKTPLWRSGPQGPKSLCNACGIRQRKARRTMATAALGGALIHAESPSDLLKLKRSDGDHTVPFKKRFKITATETTQKLSFDDTTIKLSKNSAFHRVFPQDEKDAAILLMTLSCGLLRS